MTRLALALALLLCAWPAQAQHCVPADQILARVLSGEATAREVFSDHVGDTWLVIDSKEDGSGVIGVLISAAHAFCIFAIRPKRETAPEPERGA